MPNDHYELGELLGRGGMGQVHIARHRSGRVVAIKRVRNTLSGDRLLVDRLADEARLLRTVSHPNVVRALDDGTGHDGMPFLVMDRAHGTPLNQLIREHDPLPHDRLVAIAAQLFAGLTAIHEAQVVHADLKSHNILVDDVNIVTIIDFGLARALTRSSTGNDLVAGTPAYMAPELIAGGHPTVLADIYAAGTILYEMLTGTTPFRGHISTILTRQLAECVELPSQRAPDRGISPALDRVLLRALDPSPAMRYQSVPELAAAFTDAIGTGAAAPEPPMAAGSSVWRDEPTVRRPDAQVFHMLTEGLSAELPRPADLETEQIISAALARAEQLIGARNAPLAASELEATLARLAPAHDGHAPMSAAAWRIETVLAALYETLGKHERARRMALVAYRHALATGCAVAQGRAGAMVDRLVSRGRRMARGSLGNKR
ncbi:MAG TPA: serine/threonine-protein kinase [Kofleriaceae bacterium]|nr:serine/threonine-protein kinase [Kofleriaceae bacterium]